MTAEHELPWELPLGARPADDHQTEFRVWAPRADSIALAVGRGEPVALTDAGLGVYETVAPARAGEDYRYLVNGRRLPDPCSRWQPKGLRGASRVLAPPAPAPFRTPSLD
jgi:maltooligosyltrehalose trehalohydrolase